MIAEALKRGYIIQEDNHFWTFDDFAKIKKQNPLFPFKSKLQDRYFFRKLNSEGFLQ
jgi:hypothetical protein